MKYILTFILKFTKNILIIEPSRGPTIIMSLISSQIKNEIHIWGEQN